MIPYKFFDLTSRDQTGVLLSNIHRQQISVGVTAEVNINLFQIPPENAFLLTSASIKISTFAQDVQGTEVQILDAQGNVLSFVSMSGDRVINIVTGEKVMYHNFIGSPMAVIGPGLTIRMKGIFNTAGAGNSVWGAINGVLIPRGTMAYQS